MSVAPVSGAGPSGAAGSAPAPGPFVADSLLTAPGDLHGDPLTTLLALEGKSRNLGLRGAIAGMNSAREHRHAAWEAQKHAMREAAAAAQEGGFWKKVGGLCGTVARVGAVVAAVGAAVATCGAATPVAALAIAGAVLSTAAFAQGEWRVLQRLGVDSESAGKIGTGLTIAGAVCSAGAVVGAGLAASEAEETAVEKAFELGGRIAGAGAAAGGVVAGYARWKEGEAAGEVQDRHADAVAAAATEARFGRMIDRLLSEMDEAEKSHRGAVDHLTRAIDVRGAALTAAAGRA